jgi:hypothetical protein
MKQGPEFCNFKRILLNFYQKMTFLIFLVLPSLDSILYFVKGHSSYKFMALFDIKTFTHRHTHTYTQSLTDKHADISISKYVSLYVIVSKIKVLNSSLLK